MLRSYLPAPSARARYSRFMTSTAHRVSLTGRLVCRDDAEAEAVARALPEHIALTRAEPGCISFTVDRTGDPLVWAVDEVFVDASAFRAHQDRIARSDWGRATHGIERDYTVTVQEAEA